MAEALSFKRFAGMFPRTPNQLLPDNAASLAVNCDFSKDVLGSLKGGLDVLTIESGTSAGKGFYSANGTNWYTWSEEVVGYKSPVIDETYSRIYFVTRTSGSPYVAISPEVTGTISGTPPQTWRLGVPVPASAPTLTLITRTTLPDYPTATFSFSYWWEDNGTQFGNTDVASGSVTVPTALKVYKFPQPTKPADAPDTAGFVVQATLNDGGKQLFVLNSRDTTTAPSRSAALPGGVEMSISVARSEVYVKFTWGVTDTRAYVYTYVNTWNEESAPSPAALISPTYIQDVQVGTAGAFSALVTLCRPWQKTNIYRTYGSGTYIQTTVTGTDPTYLDSSRTVTSVGTALQTLGWLPPPWTGISSMVQMPNGWFAVYKGNTLYMSEPYRPHAWPYSITFPKDITGICAGPQSLVVTTLETAYNVTGPHPKSVMQQDTGIPVGGISQKGMVKFDAGVAYLSNDGIVVVSGSQATLELSQKFFTRETWRSLYGAALPDMALGYHDGFLVCTSTTSALGFLVRLDEAEGAFTQYNVQHNAMYRLAKLDTLYYSNGGHIYRFREGSALNATWNSKDFIFQTYVKLGIGFARMTGNGTNDVQVKLYGDGSLIHTQTLSSSAGTVYFRLPANRGHLKWQFDVTISGGATLDELALAHTVDGLKNV